VAKGFSNSAVAVEEFFVAKCTPAKIVAVLEEHAT
jgi:hypothetical protein